MYNVRFFVLVNLSSPPILCQTLIKSESIYNTTVNLIIKICNFFKVIHVEVTIVWFDRDDCLHPIVSRCSKFLHNSIWLTSSCFKLTLYKLEKKHSQFYFFYFAIIVALNQWTQICAVQFILIHVTLLCRNDVKAKSTKFTTKTSTQIKLWWGECTKMLALNDHRVDVGYRSSWIDCCLDSFDVEIQSP